MINFAFGHGEGKMKTRGEINTCRKPRARLAVLLLVLFSLFVSTAYAIPTVIDFQGKLTDKNNNPQTGEFNITFRIMNQSTGGSIVWAENRNVNATNGLFSVLLGSNVLFNFTFNEDYYIEVVIAGETLSPRYRLGSAPYAFRANVSEMAVAPATTKPSFIIRAVPSQASNLTEWQNSTGAVIGYVDTSGNINVSGRNVTAAFYLGNGSLLSDVTSTSTSTNVSLEYGYNSSGGNWVGLATTPTGILRLSVEQAQAVNATNLVSGQANGTSLHLTMNLTVLKNFSVGTTTFFVDQTLGRVGIGTATPANELHVIGNLNVTGTLFGNGTSLTNIPYINVSLNYGYNGSTFVPLLSSPDGVLQMSVYDAVSENASNLVGGQSNGTALYLTGNLTLLKNLSVGTTTLFVDQTLGRVGIGTASAAATLEVSGTYTVNNISLNVNNTLYVNNSGGGRIGIGTASPANTLHVVGTANITGGLNVSAGGLNVLGGLIGVLTSGPGALLHLAGTNIANNLSLNVNDTLYVNASGRVGIGTASPTSLLHVIGRANFTNVTVQNGQIWWNGTGICINAC